MSFTVTVNNAAATKIVGEPAPAATAAIEAAEPAAQPPEAAAKGGKK